MTLCVRTWNKCEHYFISKTQVWYIYYKQIIRVLLISRNLNQMLSSNIYDK